MTEKTAELRDRLNALGRSDIVDEAFARFGGTAKGEPPSDGQKRDNDSLTEGFVLLAMVIMALSPDGRNKSLALTHLEDAKMRAVAAIFQDGAR